ncbi:MAG TPA: alpha/beta hydrolase [Solirubrobacteraceae bacterium]|nr:alpha/beta hydrolase [Solirubrobacteraceae bacterium]
MTGRFSARRLRAAILIVGAAGAVAFAASVAAGSSAESRTPAVARSAAAKPTVVLVHGAWADSSSWDGVISRLQRDGYTVVAPATPLRSLLGDAAYIASVLKSIPGPIVLVGHSYGGAVITNAATGNPNVEALVYIDAFVPDAGESVLQLASKKPGSLLPSAISEVPYSQGTDGSGIDVYIDPAKFRAVFAADVPPDQAALMAVTQRPISLVALTQPSGPPAWRTIPSWYLVGLDDKAIPPATQEFMAARAGSHTVEIDASHASLVSRPQAVTELILSAIRSIG